MGTAALYRATANADFRTLVDGPLPEAVEGLDVSTLESWTADIVATDMRDCASTCSKGPLTFICDGTTKSGI
jgi:hypothetical protein